MRRGFTLLETLVAVAILAIAIAGPLYAANRSLVAAQNARNQLTASHLAQEGIEYVRRLRDNSYLAKSTDPYQAWVDFKNSFSGRCEAGAPCAIDVLENTHVGRVDVCGVSCPLYLNKATGQYVLARPTPTTPASIFTRKVHFIWRENSLTETEVDVVSRVEWQFKGQNYNVEIINTLRPWEPAQ